MVETDFGYKWNLLVLVCLDGEWSASGVREHVGRVACLMAHVLEAHSCACVHLHC